MSIIIDAPIETLLVGYLRAVLPPFGYTMPVGTRVPNPRPTESVTLFRTGGPRRDMVTDQAQITVEVRAGLERRAEVIANTTRALINQLDGQTLDGHVVYQVQELSGPANLPDPVSGVRYSQSFLIAIRATVSPQ